MLAVEPRANAFPTASRAGCYPERRKRSAEELATTTHNQIRIDGRGTAVSLPFECLVAMSALGIKPHGGFISTRPNRKALASPIRICCSISKGVARVPRVGAAVDITGGARLLGVFGRRPPDRRNSRPYSRDPVRGLPYHHAHCIKEILHFWWAIMQLKHDSARLMRIKKSHADPVLIFRVSGDPNSLLFQFLNR